MAAVAGNVRPDLGPVWTHFGFSFDPEASLRLKFGHPRAAPEARFRVRLGPEDDVGKKSAHVIFEELRGPPEYHLYVTQVPLAAFKKGVREDPKGGCDGILRSKLVSGSPQ